LTLFYQIWYKGDKDNQYKHMEIIGSLAIVVFAALIHASFQLSVSTLTLMSGHAIGKRTAHTKLVRLAGGFLIGAAVMTTLLLSTSAFIAGSLIGNETPAIIWAASSGVLLSLGISVWLFYFRRSSHGTTLWLPRSLAEFLRKRSKQTHSSGEAFGLGLSSVIAESLFILGPILVSSLALLHLSPTWQLAGVGLYTGISMLSLLTVCALIGSGRGLGMIQKWRETNKHFMQFAAGGGLLVLSFYIYVEEVVTSTVRATGGM
jgi:hypothetical protein